MQVKLITVPSSEPVTLEELKLHLRIELDVLDEDEYLEGLIETARLDVENDSRRQIMSAIWEYYLQDWPKADRIKIPFGNLQSLLSLTIADSSCVEANGTYDLIFTGANKTAATGTYTIATNIITAVSLTSGGIGYVSTPTVATQTGDGSVTAAMVSVKWKDTDGTETTLTVGIDDDYLVETNGDQCGFIVLPYGGTWPSGSLYPSNPISIRFIAGWTTAALVPSTVKSAIKMRCSKLYESRGEDTVGQTVHEDKTYDRLVNNIPRLWDEFL